MKKLKISSIWSHGDVKYSLFTLIIKNYFNIQIEWTSPRKCDLLILGPYNIHKFYKKLLNKFILNKSNYLKLMFDDFEKEIIFRKISQLPYFIVVKMKEPIKLSLIIKYHLILIF